MSFVVRNLGLSRLAAARFYASQAKPVVTTSNLPPSKFAVPKCPEKVKQDVHGAYYREIEDGGKKINVLCNADGVICAPGFDHIEFLLPSPIPFHTYEELPRVKETTE